MSADQRRPPWEDQAATAIQPASGETTRIFGRRRRHIPAAAAVAVGLGLSAALGGYFVGHSGGNDVDAARTAGAAHGRAEGSSRGSRPGYRQGFKEGRRAGYRQAYRAAYKAA